MLEKILTQDLSRDYYSVHDIRLEDLEKKNRTGAQMITGCNLLSLSIRGVKSYKKALSFCANKWDIERNVPLDSGNKLEDCVEYVRLKMYNLLVKPMGKSNDCDSESETEELAELEGTVAEGANEDNIIDSHTQDDTMPDKVSDEKSSDEEDTEVPQNYIFPSFFVFILWGPFVVVEGRLILFLIDNKNKKKGGGTRESDGSQYRKRKISDSHNDDTTLRGFTTE